VRNPGIKNWDLSFFKNNTFKEKYNFQFRVEMFNAFNTAQFGGPGSTVGNSNFGVIGGTAICPRQIQLALQLIMLVASAPRTVAGGGLPNPRLSEPLPLLRNTWDRGVAH